MTEHEIFEKLFNGGNFALPYLVKFTHPDTDTIRLVNNNESVVYNSEEYSTANFTYNEPDNNGDGGSLSIAGIDNGLIEFCDKADYRYCLYVVGTIAENGQIQRIKGITHFYGSLSYDETGNIEFNLGKDDRLDMTFNPHMYDTESNGGNA